MSEEIKDESSPEEVDVMDLLDQGKNVFLTGSGGTGKSHLLRRLYVKLLERGKIVAKTASTGVAAESIGASTLHSWSGIGLATKTAEDYFILNKIRRSKAWKNWINTDILIIDEISMIGERLFNLLDQLGQLIRGNTRPFGGLQLLLCGDMLQLPPVKDEYIFKSNAFNSLDLSSYRLKKPWRFQKDLTFFELLSRVRLGRPNQNDLNLLEERKKAYYKEIHNKKFAENEIKPTRLFSKKMDVEQQNLQELAQLPHEEFKYVSFDNLKKKGKYGGSGPMEGYQAVMDKNVPPNQALKKGAQVMLTWNLSVEQGLCNGSRGVVIECFDDNVLVKFKSGEINITPQTWTIEDDECIFTRTQMPLILAWSYTIHKSQSATLDCVIADIGTSIFSPSMAYVVLSRIRSLEGVFLINLMSEKIYCDPDALEFELSIIDD